MYRFILLVTLVTLAAAAPEPDHKPLPLVSAAKTPASTAKLRPLGTPIATPLLAPISHLAYAAPAFHHIAPVAPYAYAYAAPYIAAAPSSYSIEQHGYNIAY